MADDLEEKQNLKTFSFGFAFCQLFGGLLVTLTALWMGTPSGLRWAAEPELRFRYHPLFMSVGMIFLYGEAILVFRVFRHERKRFTKLLHGSLHVTLLAFSIAGLVAVFASKTTQMKGERMTSLVYESENVSMHTLSCIPYSLNVDNLSTFHSWIGITTLVLFGFQFFIAFVCFVYPRFSQPIRHSYVRIHQCFGLLLFALAVVTALTGVAQRSAWHRECGGSSNSYYSNGVGVSILLYGLMVIFLVSNPKFRRRSLSDEQLEYQLAGSVE